MYWVLRSLALRVIRRMTLRFSRMTLKVEGCCDLAEGHKVMTFRSKKLQAFLFQMVQGWSTWAQQERPC